MPPEGGPFRYYFCQREAVETAVYLFEVEGIKDCGELVGRYFKSPRRPASCPSRPSAGA